jgi:hypothetical protein
VLAMVIVTLIALMFATETARVGLRDDGPDAATRRHTPKTTTS